MSLPTTNTPSTHVARNARVLSCILCSQRKIKCDRKSPCANCIKSRQDCISPASQPPRRRKKRFPEAELLSRLRFYEELLRKNGVNLDDLNEKVDALAIGDDSKSNGPQSADKMSAFSGEDAGEKLGASDTDAGNSNLSAYMNKNLWTGLSDEFRDTEEVLHGSSEDEIDSAPIQSTYDTIFPADGGGLLFGVHRKSSLTSLHPEPVHIFRLWQTFIDNVNPLLKVIHIPSTQKELLSSSGDLKNVSKGMEALMFAIYSMAIVSLDDAQCISTFGQEKTDLLAKYQTGAQHALINAGFLRSSDIVVLQALLLYLMSIRQKADPRSLFLMVGLAVRSAQRMGLHQNTTTSLPPFQVEMRRRLWWQIVTLDARVAELSGTSASILTQYWDTALPLNVNDASLHPTMTTLPTSPSTPGMTEMAFVLIRCEIGNFLKKSENFLKDPRDGSAHDGNWQALSAKQIPIAEKDRAIDTLEVLLNEKYIDNHDPSNPLHQLALAMASTAICKMRLVAHHPRLQPSRGANMSAEERDALFKWSLTITEHQNTIATLASTKGFLWHVHMNMPLDAYVYLLGELRMRPMGELAEKAWSLVAGIFEVYGGKIGGMDSGVGGRGLGGAPNTEMGPGRAKTSWTTFHIAFSNLAVKAWEARENAMRMNDLVPTAPPFITRLRESLAARRKNNNSKVMNISRSSGLDGGNSRSLINMGIGVKTDLDAGAYSEDSPTSHPNIPCPTQPTYYQQQYTPMPAPLGFDPSTSMNMTMNNGMGGETTEMDWAFWDEMMGFPVAQEFGGFGEGADMQMPFL